MQTVANNRCQWHKASPESDSILQQPWRPCMLQRSRDTANEHEDPFQQWRIGQGAEGVASQMGMMEGNAASVLEEQQIIWSSSVAEDIAAPIYERAEPRFESHSGRSLLSSCR
uniref:Uncharacterized protein n=1 Tax=Anopheles culicifacies TaxID=139723 RepID=A0A182LRS2_9DIPT